MDRNSGKPDPMAQAMEWVSRILAMCVVMILPGIGGHWLDKRLGTSFLALLGFMVGMVIGFTYLLVLTKAMSSKDDNDLDSGNPGGD